MSTLSTGVHRRKNLLTGDWVLVSPHRNDRPWKGATESTLTTETSAYQPDCALCAGNARANGEHNPRYLETFVFTNDFSALLGPAVTRVFEGEDALWVSEEVSGECRVVIFSPDHSQSLPRMAEAEIVKVVDTWVSEFKRLKTTFRWVQVFENKGDVMGCSQPHPHGQIWAHDFVPSLVMREDDCQMNYHQCHHSPLLLDYAMRESRSGERTVVENDDWIAVVPYWAAWPFETLLLPKHRIARLDDMSESLQHTLAGALKELTVRYDNLFQCSFPYSMGWHGAPNQLIDTAHWQLHAHFFPPLLRSSTIKKHMVGYEMLAEAQRDLTPEAAASALRDAGSVHYSERG
ncbi:UDP-glucose--hexose-1-phosphate uridylyltransferase [Marinimicrobium sp. C6131]|uniref:UDP-glucose--hexose-1-phosphate uridylyltransferase n=1 Tax=Marinimicrobium sp. C6131 TaxID=3022676 RepID=UPI00223D2D09|nr:UDP-glucose--hexose-1-phosphate uridylyltransferase [Marinimicrobium sp. C6131]UZJ44535.1 UDP-glucose--hexose-1-phosphate uridylyltransferase [Marinimicrobium sp. C6131]